MNRTLSMPNVTICTLPKATIFEPNDVLYKIVGERLCKYLVLEIKGESTIKVRAFQNGGADLSNHTFEVQGKELDLYQVDVAHTKLRKAFYDLVRKNDQQ